MLATRSPRRNHRKGMLSLEYWTLTRSDDLGEEDISLLARARFSIGIGLESGSPDMLRIMNKGNKPEKYLAAVEQLSALSQQHGLNWAVNVIVGHPGETPRMANETLDFVTRLFRRTDNTRGFLSIDPFRLYPGSYIHETMDEWEAQYGAKFFHRDWWRAWYDHGFLAQHLDASDSMRFEQRVAFMHDNYRPLLQEIRQRFVGQNRPVDRVYQQSMQGQIDALSPEIRAATLRSGQAAVTVATARPEVRVPLGMNQKDSNVRIREAAVRRLLDRGVLRTESLVEALLTVDPSAFMSPAASEAMFGDRPLDAPADGIPAPALSISALATALEALEPSTLVCVMGAVNGYVPSLLAAIAGPSVAIIVRTSPALCDLTRLCQQLESSPTITVQSVPLAAMMDADEPVHSLFIGACLPLIPRSLDRSLLPTGRAVFFVGPRFRHSRLLTADNSADGVVTHRGPKFLVPIMAGTYGWIRKPVTAVPQPSQPIRFSRRPAPALCYRLLPHLDLGQDAASMHDPSLIKKDWEEPLRLAYQAAPGRLTLQAHALAHAGVDGWLQALTERTPQSLQDNAGRHLIDCVTRAAAAERDDFDDWWTQTRGELSQRTVGVGGQLAQPLARLRDRLWEAQNKPVPPLVVVDAPALGAAGRATTVGDERVVAVSFAQPLAHVLMQVLHEEIHPITDPLVLAELGDVQRDTHVNGDGFGVHQELEQTAVMATEAFLTQRARERMPDFRRWHQQVFGSASE
ncbi:MAG: protein-L-isoaspartate O-methyltransferase [Myxococcota bacterium]|jgi:protein-L-isoaspartate O-methyltransferase